MEHAFVNIEADEINDWWYAWSGPRDRPTFSRRSRSFDWAFASTYVQARGGNADGLDEALAMARTEWYRPDAARIYEESRMDVMAAIGQISMGEQ